MTRGIQMLFSDDIRNSNVSSDDIRNSSVCSDDIQYSNIFVVETFVIQMFRPMTIALKCLEG